MAASKQASFLNIDEARAVAPSVFRSGRRDDVLPPDLSMPCPTDVERDETGLESFRAFWNAWFTPVTPTASTAPSQRVEVIGASWRTSDSDFSDVQETPTRPEPPEIIVEVSEYEFETDSDVVTPVSQHRGIATPSTAGTPSEAMKRLMEEEEELNIAEAARQAEEQALRAQEAVMRAEQEAARAEEEARQAKAKADLLSKAGELLTEKRDLPSRRISSWTGAQPKKGILKSRHSVAPVLAMGAKAISMSDDDQESTLQEKENTGTADPFSMLDDYGSSASPSSRRASMGSLASRRSSLTSPTSRRTSIASTSQKVSCAKTRRVSINVGNQIGGGKLIPMVDYDTSPSGRSQRLSTNIASDGLLTPETSEANRDMIEGSKHEAEVAPAALQRIHRASSIAPPPRITEKGTMIRESLDSGFEVILDPQAPKSGLVDCGIQCSGAEIDAEIRIMYSKYEHMSQSGVDIPPGDRNVLAQEQLPTEDLENVQKKISFDEMKDVQNDPNAEMSPKTPGLGRPMAIENKLDSEPRVRFTDQPFSVQTPGQTITYATTKSIIASGTDDEAKDSDDANAEKENRLQVTGGELVIVELPEKQASAKKNVDSPEKEAEADECERTPTGTGTKKHEGEEVCGPGSVQKSIQLDIPPSAERRTPVKKRKSLVQPVRRSSRRLSDKHTNVAQALDFNDESKATPEQSSRSKRTRKSKSPSQMPQPFVIEEEASYQAGVMQLEIPQVRRRSKRSRKSKFVYNGKSFLSDVVLFEIQPSESVGNGESENEHDPMDMETAAPHYSPSVIIISPSPGPSTRSRTTRKGPLSKSEPSESVGNGESENEHDPMDMETAAPHYSPSVIVISPSPGPSTRSRTTRKGPLSKSEQDNVRLTRSRSKSEKSQAASRRSGRQRSVRSKPSPPGKDVSDTQPASSKTVSASASLPFHDNSQTATSSKRSGLRSARRMSDIPAPELDNDAYDDNHGADDFDYAEEPVEIDPDAGLEDFALPESAMSEEIEPVAPMAQFSQRRVSRSALRSAGDSSHAGPSAPPAAPPVRQKTRTRGARAKSNIPRELRNLDIKKFPVEDPDEEGHVRRSKRQRFPRLGFWNNEKVVYERRKSQILPTIAQVVVALNNDDASDSESSTASWLARGKIPRQTADRQSSRGGASKQPAPKTRRGRKRTR